MAKIDKRQRFLMILLIIVLLGAAIDFTINTDDYLRFYGSKKETVRQNSNTTTKLDTINTKEKKLSQYNRWGRDPFHDLSIRTTRIYKAPQTDEVSLYLSAISVADGGSVAMINSKIVTVGDDIEGYIVKKIEPKQVFLEKNGQIKTVQLQREDILDEN